MHLFTPLPDLDAAHQLLSGLAGVSIRPHGARAFEVYVPDYQCARRLLRGAGARVRTISTPHGRALRVTAA